MIKIIRNTFLMNQIRRHFHYIPSTPEPIIKDIYNLNFKYNLDYNEIYKEEKKNREGQFCRT